MKKIIFFLLISIHAACQASDTDSTDNKNENNNESQLEVDKNLLNVEITLPASMFEGEDIDSIIAAGEDEEGIKEITKNENGSLTYKMTKAKHRELMEEVEAGISESIDEIVNSGDYPSIKNITHNKTYTEFTVEVEKEAFENSFDGFAILGLGMPGAYYQFYNGADPDSYQVKVVTKDQETQEIIGETIYPDDLESEE